MSHTNKESGLKHLLEKYLQGQSSVKENQAIEDWYDQLGKGDHKVPPLESSKRKAELKLEIKQYLINRIVDRTTRKRAFQYFKYAAIFLLLIGGALIGRNVTINSKKDRHDIIFESSDKTAKLITLKDGSSVLLNVGSSLTVSKDFGDSIRQVRLTGEAFFEIAKDTKHPFIVQAGKLKTKVLGTSFNINAYEDLDQIKVGVLTGKVQVSTADGLLASGMTKGKVLFFNKNSGTTTLKTEQTDYIAIWRDSKLNIESATIREIASQLQRYYHVKVNYDNSFDNEKRYSIRFDREPADRVMEILSILTKKKFTYKTDQITIK